jgi:hypothetical protein
MNRKKVLIGLLISFMLLFLIFLCLIEVNNRKNYFYGNYTVDEIIYQ